MFAKCLQTNGKASKISKTYDEMGFLDVFITIRLLFVHR